MYDNIADMDAQVGEILKELEDDGLADNTIVFYWSDHGDGVPRAKRSLYDSGLRVPLMIRWPKSLGSPAAPGSVRDDLVSFIDLAPTVLALAGVEIPAHLPGRVLAGPRAGPAPRLRLRRARSDGHRVRHDALGARRTVPLHPQLLAGAALRRAHHLSQPERHHAGVVPAAGGAKADRAGRPLDAHAIVRRRSSTTRRRIRTRSATCRRSRRTARRSSGCAKRCTDWMARTGDQGLINEPEMIQRMWPGGVQPETAQPYIVPRRTTDDAGAAGVDEDRRANRVVIYVPTQGASVGYTTEEGPAAKWRLYTGPILVEAPMTLRAKAIRYGYKESAETRVTFTK